MGWKMDIPEAYTMVVDTYRLFRVSVALGLTKLPYKKWSDEILADRIARGDVGALETLYDRHAAMILGIALKITDDRALAEDILQETFWRVWQRAGTYQPERGAFTSWLFRMARHLAMDATRRQ
ncbi:MAG TPA: sigma-70 family RNA polymerase sigma factor [Anaerolineales bacterium]|nr:sigma-70 family RNA polymerase sigma factor [Anaerolineales bacterium]